MNNVMESRPLDRRKFNWLISPKFCKKKIEDGVILFVFMSNISKVEVVCSGGFALVERSKEGLPRKLKVIRDDVTVPNGHYAGVLVGNKLKILYSRRVRYKGRLKRTNLFNFTDIRKNQNYDFYSALVERDLLKIEDRRRDQFLVECYKTRELSRLLSVRYNSELVAICREEIYMSNFNDNLFQLCLKNGEIPLGSERELIKNQFGERGNEKENVDKRKEEFKRRRLIFTGSARKKQKQPKQRYILKVAPSALPSQ